MSERIIEGLATILANPAGCSAIESLRLFTALSLVAIAMHAVWLWIAALQIRASAEKPGPRLDALFRDVVAEMRLSTTPRLLVVDRGAFTVGFWTPDVCVGRDVASRLDDDELRAVMLHELAHVERRDTLGSSLMLFGTWLAVTLSAEAILTGGLLHMGAQRSRTAIVVALALFVVFRFAVLRPGRFLRELTCDDLAIRASADPLALASALVKTSRVTPVTSAISAFVSEETLLLHRVRRLLDYKPPIVRLAAQRAATIAALAGALALLS